MAAVVSQALPVTLCATIAVPPSCVHVREDWERAGSCRTPQACISWFRAETVTSHDSVPKKLVPYLRWHHNLTLS